MAPIKFEENIKDKLEKRSIQPSLESWNVLSNKLDAQGRNRNNKRYWWFGVAASVVGVILVTTQLLNNKTIDHQSTEIVNTETEVTNDTPNIQETILIEDLNLEKTQLTTVISEIKISNQESVDDINTSDNVPENKDALIKKRNNASLEYAQVIKKKTDESPKLKNSVLNEVPFEQIKLNEVVAQIQTMSEGGKLVSEEDIDALLMMAEKEIIANKIYNENTKVVDASALLQDVEADLDQSFRNKVFKTLKSSYYTVKNNVADRNN